MRLGKVHGRTVTEHKAGKKKNKLVRKLSVTDVNNSDGEGAPKTVSISKISIENKKLLIGQWISVIDKVFAKPIDNENPSKEQFDHRDGLSRACWEKLHAEKFVSNDDKDYWKQRSHPYGVDFIETGEPEKKHYAAESEPGLYGHWRNAFSGDDSDYEKLQSKYTATYMKKNCVRTAKTSGVTNLVALSSIVPNQSAKAFSSHT